MHTYADIFPDLPTPRILLVEDDDTLSEVFLMACRQLGIQVVGRAATTVDAIRFVSSACPSVAFLDLRLSDMENGGIAVAIHCARCGIPFVYMTAFGETIDTFRAIAKLPPQAILRKPYRAIEILDALTITSGNRYLL